MANRALGLALTAAGRSTKLAVALLSQTGLEEPPDSVAILSGGMRKRAGVARGLAAELGADPGSRSVDR